MYLLKSSFFFDIVAYIYNMFLVWFYVYTAFKTSENLYFETNANVMNSLISILHD